MVSGTAISDGLKLESVQSICKRVIGKRVAPATLWRWIKQGVKGGKLEAVHVNGAWHCTTEAFADFLNRQTAAKLAIESRDSTPAADDDALRAAGLL